MTAVNKPPYLRTCCWSRVCLAATLIGLHVRLSVSQTYLRTRYCPQAPFDEYRIPKTDHGVECSNERHCSSDTVVGEAGKSPPAFSTQASSI